MEEEVVNKKAEEDKKKKRTSLKSILGGDILATDFFRRQTKLLVLIMVFIIFYIHNRYASQQQQIEIDRLKKELTDIKYDALTRSSELMEKSRQSRIEDYISSKESDLQTSTNPPYLIKYTLHFGSPIASIKVSSVLNFNEVSPKRSAMSRRRHRRTPPPENW